MATIASQIKRIQDATAQLRDKGIGLELNVSAGEALSADHRLDDVAKAFDSIVFSKGEVKNVELKVVTHGDNTIAGNSYELPTGYYKGLVIKPFFTQTSADEVLNIKTITNYEISSNTGEITPGSGFNYMDKVTYTVNSGAINTDNAGFGNNYVTAKVGTAGWLNLNATKNITVPTAEIKSKVGSEAATTLSDVNTTTTAFTVSPKSGADTVLTIAAGVYGSNRTITVKSLASQMTNATVTAADILSGKIAYGNNGTAITGEMPNYGGTSSAIKTTSKASITTSGELIVTPRPGYYNEYSRISTGVTVGAATYKQTQADLNETDHKFEIMPAEDTDGGVTTYLTQVTVDNSYIYGLLAAI